MLIATEISEDVKKEREDSKARSVQAVRKAIADAQCRREYPRPLRRFGCQLTVRLVHHTVDKHNRQLAKTKLVVSLRPRLHQHLLRHDR